MRQEKSSGLPIFSVRLGELLSNKGVTQQQVAAATGVAQSTISHYLRGTRATPRVEEVLALAAYFAVPVEWLFGTNPPPSIQSASPGSEQNEVKTAEVKKILATMEEQLSSLRLLLDGGSSKEAAHKRRRRDQE